MSSARAKGTFFLASVTTGVIGACSVASKASTGAASKAKWNSISARRAASGSAHRRAPSGKTAVKVRPTSEASKAVPSSMSCSA